MNIVFAPNAIVELNAFQKKDQVYLRNKLSQLMEYEDILKHPKIKKLKYFPYYRYRVGKFRVFFNMHGEVMLINKVSQRSEKTYKKK